MTAIRIIITFFLIAFGILHLWATYNAADKHVYKAVWAGGVIGLLEMALAYVIWL